MSMGSWRAVLSLSAKDCVKSTYSWSEEHVQQVVVRSMACALLVAMILVPVLQGSKAEAGVLISSNRAARAEDFFDWTFAQKVWFEMNTWDKEEAEWAKYSADFNAWLENYKKDSRKALSDLKRYPAEKRKNIERGYDIQLAYDDWFNRVYTLWYQLYRSQADSAAIHGKKQKTFDDLLKEKRAETASCVPVHKLTDCGPWPDWRDAQDRKKEQAMMTKADAEAADYARRWNQNYGNVGKKK